MGKYDVFLSHSLDDRVFVQRLVKSLRSQGVDVFMEKKQRKPGSNWAAAFTAGIKKSAHVVTVLDPNDQSQPNLYFEAGAAIGMGKKVTFVVPGGARRLKRDLHGGSVLARLTPESTARDIVESLKSGARVSDRTAHRAARRRRSPHERSR